LPLGVIGHEGSTVLVCLNGLRLLMIGNTNSVPSPMFCGVPMIRDSRFRSVH
jgi:hypothetical protein